MLKLVPKSSNKKLGGCAATYRSGIGDVYSTCPSTCSLKPTSSPGTPILDFEYVNAVKTAVPQNGVAWTYTHFPREMVGFSKPNETCINISTDSVEEAVQSFSEGYPTVVVVSSTEIEKVDRPTNTLRFVRCPAEYSDATCDTCGGDRPLCARPERDYVIKFTAHGNQAKKINDRVVNISSEAGGCYGNSGPVRLQWEKTKGATENDASVLTTFVASLPAGTKLRHHVVGDLGFSRA